MAQTEWGKNAKGSGGGDPNVLSLQETSRIRLLEPSKREWRQHYIESTTDKEQGRSVVCPRGADGRGQTPCPCCMKPVRYEDGKLIQNFAVSRRFATNVYDYESNSVKVLIAGPQVFDVFDNTAQMGLDPTGSDWHIHKAGKNINTKYTLVRGDTGPLPREFGPDDLHDLDKYEAPTSTEKIFEIMQEMGWDYDALVIPTFTVEDAEAFQMPYGKHKGMTLEQLIAHEPDYLQFMHDRIGGNSPGDPVFLAMQAILEDRGLVGPLDTNVPKAPPQPQATAQADAAPATPATAPSATGAEPGTVVLIDPTGNEVEVPEAAKASLLAAGFQEMSAPVAKAVPSEPADDEQVAVDISGTNATMAYAQAKPLIASGVAKLLDYDFTGTVKEPERVPEPPDDEQIQFKLNVVPTPIPMAYGDAKGLFLAGQGDFVGDRAEDHRAFAKAGDAADDKAVAADAAQAAAVDPHPPAGSASGVPTSDATGQSLDPALTVQGDDGRWRHPALPGKDYGAKGAVTQALNRLGGTAAPAPDPAGQTANAPAPTNGAAPEGIDAKREQAKNMVAQMPNFASDFNALLEIFQSVAGKRNIMEFDEAELDKLIARLQAEQAPASA